MNSLPRCGAGTSWVPVQLAGHARTYIARLADEETRTSNAKHCEGLNYLAVPTIRLQELYQ
ncbi:hypothetical protein [Streptomyces lincolnensis]|uniref:hypothetical protein n=1 Tax=Streptomyces lincolnensis TaxID=1915 RepID=UPI0037D13058